MKVEVSKIIKDRFRVHFQISTSQGFTLKYCKKLHCQTVNLFSVYNTSTASNRSKKRKSPDWMVYLYYVIECFLCLITNLKTKNNYVNERSSPTSLSKNLTSKLLLINDLWMEENYQKKGNKFIYKMKQMFREKTKEARS